MTQVIQTPEQQLYVARLIGYDYSIQFRSGKTNLVADALSWIPQAPSGEFLLLSMPHFEFINELKRELVRHPQFIELRQNIIELPQHHADYKITQDLILKDGCIWLPSGFQLISSLLMEFHSTPSGDHMGIMKTMAKLSDSFTWSGMKRDIQEFIVACLDCQHTKYETNRFTGLLCPLPVPARPWEDLSLDFIVGLPPYRGHTTILVVVDRFSKGVHLGMLSSLYTAHNVTMLFMDIVGKLNGLPKSLVSDRDPLFISRFWQELFRLCGTTLRMSSMYHP